MEPLSITGLPDRRNNQQHSWKLPTRRKRQRENLHRTAHSKTESISTGILVVALLSMVVSAGSKLWPSSVVSAFAPQHHVRVMRSKYFGSLGSTLAPRAIPATKDHDNENNSADTLRVEVWDGVFSLDVCKDLHELAIDHSERTTGEEDDEENDDDDSLQGSSIFFHRGPNRSEKDQLTPIEQALDSFLNAYYDRDGTINEDPNREVVVEYWCRQEHLDLEAHADVDEVLFERSCKTGGRPNLRYPSIGHVLYLTKPTLGVGPTCVFPPQGSDTENCIKDEIESVVTIPAVAGRVLRFPGNALHGVPMPADVWFSQDDEGCDSDGEDEWYDEGDEERSVILFNTWERSSNDTAYDFPVGPIGVPLDPMFHVDTDIGIVDMMMSSVDMEGVEVDEDFVKGMVAYARQQKNQKLKDWYEKFCLDDLDRDPRHPKSEDDKPVIYSKLHCQPSDMWELAQIDKSLSFSEDKGTIRVPLLGDETRRRYHKSVVQWTIPSCFENGVKELEKPCEFPLVNC